METNGWRPIMPPSTTPAPPKTEEEMRAAAATAENGVKSPPKKNASRFPDDVTQTITLENLSPPPIDPFAESQQSGDDHPQLRLRRQKRPPFKTAQGPLGAGSEPQAFRITSDSHFIRHFPDLADSQFRHRPIETNSGAGFHRTVHAPLPDGHFLQPSREMLPPTAPSRPLFPSATDGQHFRLRSQQPAFHSPQIIFHGQVPIPQQQRYPTVARPSDPLPGSLLRPHGERTPLTDSSAFRTGGLGFHHRPTPVQWPNPLLDTRPSFTAVTNTPLVEDHRPWSSSSSPGHEERRPETAAGFSAQANRGSSDRKPQVQPVGTTVIVPEIQKNPFVTVPSFKGKEKHQKEEARPHFLIPKTEEQIGGNKNVQVIVQHLPVDSSLNDQNIDVGSIKTSVLEAGFPSRISKKPFRESTEGKPFVQGLTNEEPSTSREKQKTEPLPLDSHRDEQPNFSGTSKRRQNANFRKRPQEAQIEQNEDTMDHTISAPGRGKFTPNSENVKGQTGRQRYRVRKRRPKPTAQSHEIPMVDPSESQDNQKLKQDVIHPDTMQKEDPRDQNDSPPHDQRDQSFFQVQGDSHHSGAISLQQSDEYDQQRVQEQTRTRSRPEETRKRTRRPTRIRKPIKEPEVQPTLSKDENYVPSQATFPEEEPSPKQKSRLRPILRTRRPKPTDTTAAVPIQNIATAPDDQAPYIKEEMLIEKPKKVRVRPSIKHDIRDNYGEKESQITADPLVSQTGGFHNPIIEPQVSYLTENAGFRNPVTDENVKNYEPTSQDESEQNNDSSLIHVNVKPEFPETTVMRNIEEEIESPKEDENLQNEREKPNIAYPTVLSYVPEQQEISTTTTTTQAPVLSTTEAQTTTTTTAPSSAFGIRSRLRTGSRPRFSVKDYRERLNRLSQLSGRGNKNTTESSSSSEDTVATGTGSGPTAPSRERWFPGRRQQQTLQEQQQLQHQRLQASSTRNEADTQSENPKTESRDRYRPRAPSLRPRPTASDSKEAASETKEERTEESTTTTYTSRYRSRYGGRQTTTSRFAPNSDVTTTENPTSRRRGLLTTYGLRRPYPLKLRSGTKTTTEPAETQYPVETTPMTASEEKPAAVAPVYTQSTNAPTTTTTTTTLPYSIVAISTAAPIFTTTSTEKSESSSIVENEVTESANSNVDDIAFNRPIFKEENKVPELGELLPQDEVIVAEDPMESSEESEDYEDPAQRVSALTLWATTGNSEKVKIKGAKDSGLVTFSAVPSSAFSSRFVTMATEDPVLPLEAFFFGPSTNSKRSLRENA